MQYRSLADAAIVTGNPAYGCGTTKVYFWKGSFAKDALMGLAWLQDHKLVPTRESIEHNHVLIGTINLDHPEDVFEAMQGEKWSPNGEARTMIQLLDCHTTMCVGDIVEVNGVLWFCDNMGFKKLE